MQEKSPNKISKHTKDTRWDKIRKKHLSHVNLTTATVKKLFDMNFVDEKQLKLMAADPAKYKLLLDPVQVMNCRHQMVTERIDCSKLNSMLFFFSGKAENQEPIGKSKVCPKRNHKWTRSQ
jgi:hypothetical protein